MLKFIRGVGRNLLLILVIFAFTCSLAVAKNQTKPIRIILDWFVNPDHAPIFVAQQQGFFKKHGLKVTIIPPADPSDSGKLVAVGKADIAVTYQPQFMKSVARGMPLVRIATLIATPLDCLVTLKGGSIHKISDLKGKRIGYSMAGTDDIMLQAMLKAHGLKLKDVKLINVHYGLTQALLAGQIDAFTGAMRNFEPLEIELVGKQAQLFYPEENAVPIYDELILITTKKELHDPRLKSFIEAMQEGVIYLINHPNSTWKIFVKNHPELNNQLNKRAWLNTLPRFALRPGLLDQEHYKKYTKFLQKQGILKKKLNIEDYAVQL